MTLFAEIFRDVVDRNEILGEEFDKSKQEVDQLKKEVALWRKAYLQDQQDFENAKDEAKALKQQLADLDGPKVHKKHGRNVLLNMPITGSRQRSINSH